MRQVVYSLIGFVCSLMMAHAQVSGTESVPEGSPQEQGVSNPLASNPLDSAYLAQIDSTMQAYEVVQKQRQVEQVVRRFEEARLKKEMSMGVNGVLPLARGLLLSWTDYRFVKRPALFEQKGDRCNWVDYGVAGAPLVANWVMKAAGVKSRSKLERMLTANAMALGISFGASEILKQTVKETRPDQSNDHAFPSGHTSFAFVSASVLSREYGYISPWITVGGYATATGTQLLRIEHNKHWLNDLYMGAGIGMVSTNLAYFLTDKIFGSDAINKPEVRRKDVLRLMKFNALPSGVSLVAGTEFGSRKVHFDDAMLKLGSSLSTGVDVSWHTSPYVSIEMMARITDAQVKVYSVDPDFTGDNLSMYHLDVGAKFGVPIALGHRVGTRAFVGTRIMDGISLTNGVKTYSIPDETKFECGLGVSYECLDTDNYAWGIIADYYHTFSPYMKNRYNISSVWKILF